jgi:hypothetical protein
MTSEIQSKPCIKCGDEKPISHFHRNHKMADGHLNSCKLCGALYGKQKHLRHMNDPVWIFKNRAKARAYQERRKQLGLFSGQTNKQSDSESKRRWEINNPTKVKAKYLARLAVASGVLKRPQSCQRCEKSADRLEKHHSDYSKPLQVEWLCCKCHGKTKRKDQFVP